MGNILEFVPGDSFLHRLNPITKIVLAFLFCICSLLSNNLLIQVGLLAFLMIIAFAAGIGEKAMGGAAAHAAIFLYFNDYFAADFHARRGGIPGPARRVPAGNQRRALLCGAVYPADYQRDAALLMMFAITQMNDLTNAMVNRLHVPYRYMFILTTAFRFIPILAGEFHDIMDAQKARGWNSIPATSLKRLD